MTDNHLWHHAAAMAAQWHEHKYRNDDKTPYFAHPARVAMIIAIRFGFTDEKILAAAYLHDVIEDADADYDDVHEHFGRDVADYVAAMSKDTRLIEDDREWAYDEQLAAGPWQGRLIKLADVYDNLSDARTVPGKRKIIDRGERALRLAAVDEQLTDACRKLRDLMTRVQAEIPDS
ncbi:MAG: HD domain-containing protein [Phycisphaerales bacterium]|nr:MAG: HD domain-containing protein [Phycisphaerales bacterium]